MQLSSWISRPFFLAFVTGVLLIFCFPQWNVSGLAWIALIPLLLAQEVTANRKQAFVSGFLSGLIFYLVSLHWMTHVTSFGWMFLTLLEALFMGIFALFVFESKRIKFLVVRIIWIALAWLVCEFSRSELPIFGLGWNILAYSQSDQSIILQSANTVGAYGLGFVIALVNAIVFQLILFARKKQGGAGLWVVIVLLAGIFGSLISHGVYHEKKFAESTGNLRISVIQGNIEERLKWKIETKDLILNVHLKLSELAAQESPDLIVWPEAAFPGYFNRDLDRQRVISFVERYQVPVMVGSPHYEKNGVYYNSAYLIDENAEEQGRYDKLYLVPFGEYVPLQMIFGFLQPIADALGVGDFSPGREYRIFNLKNKIPFAALICFEDVFPHLARNFVERGAQFLLLMTNDAWFNHSDLPYQHLQPSIFRAVENGVPIVRAANTGISAFISAKGEVFDQVSKDGQRIFVTDQKTAQINLTAGTTYYRMGGYLFPYVAFALFVSLFLIRKKMES